MSVNSRLSELSDPLAALVAAVQAVGEDADRVAAILASFRQAHVVMTTAEYNGELAATYQWQQDMKARIKRYNEVYGGLPEPIDFGHLNDYPLEYTLADDSDNF